MIHLKIFNKIFKNFLNIDIFFKCKIFFYADLGKIQKRIERMNVINVHKNLSILPALTVLIQNMGRGGIRVK